MKLVLDTNTLFTFFWKGSLIKKLLAKKHTLYSPEFALEELNKHKQDISNKTHISFNDFTELINGLKSLVIFIEFSQYSNKIPEAFELLPEHAKDIDFLALALKLNASIVSNDKELLKQSRIKIFNKTNIVSLL